MPLVSLDDRLAIWIATHRYTPLDDVFVRLGTIERLGLVWIVLAFVACLVTRRGLAAAVGWTVLVAVVTFAADAASLGVKDLVQRTRPFDAHPQIHPLYVVHSSSFPAGHAATAFAGATLLSYLAPRAAPLFVLLAAVIGYSRVYVGVHYPGDVVAGAAVGVLCGLVAIGLVLAVRGGRPSSRSALRLRTG
jgi:undecaprenyl-diphosphatase